VHIRRSPSAYTQIVTISTDNILETREFRTSVGAQWTFLSDARRTVQKDLDIQEYTDPYHDPMIPHTLVLKPGLVIHSVYNGYWFWGRPSFEDLRRDLREVTREIRPDWDLAAPSLREAWANGRPLGVLPPTRTSIRVSGELRMVGRDSPNGRLGRRGFLLSHSVRLQIDLARRKVDCPRRPELDLVHPFVVRMIGHQGDVLTQLKTRTTPPQESPSRSPEARSLVRLRP